MKDVRRGMTNAELIGELYRLESLGKLDRCDEIRLEIVLDELISRQRASGETLT